jgi:hypothetical protein
MYPTLSRLLARLSLVVPAIALLVGCGGGTPVATHDRGSLETPTEAPSDGEYGLYTGFPSSRIKGPLPLKKGDRLGFRTAETGRIHVVAGEEEWTYEDATMVWKRKE